MSDLDNRIKELMGKSEDELYAILGKEVLKNPGLIRPKKFKSGDLVTYRSWFRTKHSEVVAPIMVGKMTDQWVYELKDGKAKLENELSFE